MTCFSAETEAEIYSEIHDWWDELSWEEKVEKIDDRQEGFYQMLLEFAAELDKGFAREAQRAGQSGALKSSYHIAQRELDDFLYSIADCKGIIDEEFGKRLAGEYK